MLKREVFPYYERCTSELAKIYKYLKSQMAEGYAEELCLLRGYPDMEQGRLIREMHIGSCDNIDVSMLGDMVSELGLLNRSGEFLLNGRYIIPVYGVDGELITLIGYYPDKRKYITAPAPFFSKELLWFNFRQAYELSWGSYNGFVIVVEGIFDCLSLRSIGLPCMACMGATVSRVQGEQLKLFRKVLAIPDDDKAGRRALDRYGKYGWKVPSNTTMLKFNGGIHEFGGNKVHCKDMDNLVSWFEAKDVREILLYFQDCKEEVDELII